jgi:hypothetical protein
MRGWATEGVRLIAVSVGGGDQRRREGGGIFDSKSEQWRLVIKICISAIKVPYECYEGM